ncbi:phospholipase D-like domain-containing protein [Luteibaculum oceani]|uniref:Phospholipase D-like domain-containing protein n=1 Tax=Luteibaculum oceani TaxID=1294296 RepID=A0A5C6UUD3_9FLAO|nr:hypothetical protein [Luteibaculum oceani]TXC76927.1 hypothetical protein FRX97_09935 [Luteibaculum oceani]
MSKFLTGNDLDNAIYDTIWEADRILMIVSPFIKLDDYFKKLFDRHLNNHKLHIIIVFGKNQNNVRRSLSKRDFDYFKQFQNISIIYVPNLHAKYYGNEKQGIITSINLYDHSFKNNIEFGVFSEQNIFGKLKPNADNDAWNKCREIADTNEVVFIKRPVYHTKKLLVTLSKNFVTSEVIVDHTKNYYSSGHTFETETKKLPDFPLEIERESEDLKRPTRVRKEAQNPSIGYCIRTGKKIRYNPKEPLSKTAWLSWNEYRNPDYPEKYCHKTGKKSFGKTSMSNPILE